MEIQPQNDHPTIRAHKRQFTWQILIPFLVMAGLIIAGAVLVVTGGGSQTEVWTDISIIWLIAPALILALVVLAIVITTVYGMAKLMQILPHYTGNAQTIFARVANGTRKVADGAVKPVVWVREAGAMVKSLFRKS